MKRLFIILIGTLLIQAILMPALRASSLSPEDFGGVGDGVNDDAPAFNKCISSGKPVELKRGKIYLLKSRLEGITADRFVLKGNGACVVVDADYPLRQYDNIFCFCDGSYTREYFKISDLKVIFLPGKKFSDKFAIGDTFCFNAENCSVVIFNNVSFEAPSLYNNVTFFSTFGVRKLKLKYCVVKINTLSKQGGAVWLMNKYSPKTDVRIQNCSFEHDTWDECICFAASDLSGPESSKIRAVVRDCKFISACKSESSGFVIVYNHYPSFANIRTSFFGCVFQAKGKNTRKIVSYQTGADPSIRYGVMRTTFRNCDFSYDSEIEGDSGLLSLGGISDTTYEDFLFDFKNCRFKIRNIHPLIGDKDGSRMGRYVLTNCTIDSDSDPFKKYYNVPTSEIYVSINGREKRLSDESSVMQ